MQTFPNDYKGELLRYARGKGGVKECSEVKEFREIREFSEKT